jgi:molybdenum-dependent DNA-binding transcriptional regulator ModE
MAAFLGQVGGGEIDGDAAGRQRQAGGDQGGAHPLTRFGDRLIAEADDVERHRPTSDLDLDVDRARLDAFERHRSDPRDHASPAGRAGGRPG